MNLSFNHKLLQRFTNELHVYIISLECLYPIQVWSYIFLLSSHICKQSDTSKSFSFSILFAIYPEDATNEFHKPMVVRVYVQNIDYKIQNKAKVWYQGLNRCLTNRVYLLLLAAQNKPTKCDTIPHTDKVDVFPYSLLSKLDIQISRKLSLTPLPTYMSSNHRKLDSLADFNLMVWEVTNTFKDTSMEI